MNSYDGLPLTTLVATYDEPFGTGGYQAVLALAFPGDEFPRVIFTGFGLFVGDGTVDPMGSAGFHFDGANVNLICGSGGQLILGGDKIILNAPSDDITFQAGDGPIITDAEDGHTYRIISTNGVLSTLQIT